MRLRQAKKIMKNVRLYKGMLWLYGTSRVDKANRICIHHYSRVNPAIKKWNILVEKKPLLALKILNKANQNKKQKQS